ncbi:MAG: hypothetical protein AMS24_05095 [Chlamydiae bacterium SM23_39]|nr:MAG: hypothetical protein AMS24_05095 [Chlamydiae bacterium SM23_39]
MKEIFNILSSVKDISLTSEEREEKAIRLAFFIIKEANKSVVKKEKRFNHILQNSHSHAFFSKIVDRVFRSKKNRRVKEQILKLLYIYKISKNLPFIFRLKLFIFRMLGKKLGSIFVFAIKNEVIKIFSPLLLYKEKKNFFLDDKKKKNIKISIASPKEKSLGDLETEEHIKNYLNNLFNPKIDTISIKLSSLSSKKSKEYFFEIAFENIKKILKIAKEKKKEIVLEMELYQYFYLTIDIFKKILEIEEFYDVLIGITLQSYIPESFIIQKEITSLAKDRVKKGGKNIKLILVKGAYLGYEQVIASKKGWPQAPYKKKSYADANFKKMLLFGMKKENMEYVKISLGTHNIFDISFALVLGKENKVYEKVEFQMLKGYISHIVSVLFKITKNIKIYSPAVDKKEFNSFIYFLLRRIEENSKEENFLKYAYNFKKENYEKLKNIFSESIKDIYHIEHESRNIQKEKKVSSDLYVHFDNERETDLFLSTSLDWKNKIIEKYKDFKYETIPLFVGEEQRKGEEKKNFSLDDITKPIYSFTLADKEAALASIEEASLYQNIWKDSSLEKRCEKIKKASDLFREKREDFIGILMLDSAKILKEADREISQAIDMMEYYILRVFKLKKMDDLSLSSKGIIYIATSRSFPFSDAIGRIIAALICGNCVIFKPAPDTVLSSWFLVNALWDAGIPKKALQFIPCLDEIAESTFLVDKRISSAIIIGRSKTIEKLVKINPYLEISASCEGKNFMIVTAMADRSLAIENIIKSAFSFAGQKYCSSSLVILEKEVYEDKNFRKKLLDAALNLKIGSVFDVKTDMGPLLKKPNEEMIDAMKFLDKKEKWLLKPKQDPKNPLLWSLGIKLNVTSESYIYNNFLPIPLLGIMKAKNLSHAIKLANGTKYALSFGIQSLDEEEHIKWKSHIEGGNYYINRSMRGTIIRRQPFGGYKNSSYGKELKAGGPNYLIQCIKVQQNFIPKEKKAPTEKVNSLSFLLERIELSSEELALWYASISNYSYWWSRMKIFRDPTKIVGQDNFFGYVPRRDITLRITEKTYFLDALRVCAAALTCGCPLRISYLEDDKSKINWSDLSYFFDLIEEDEKQFHIRVLKKEVKRIRLTSKSNSILKEIASSVRCFIEDSLVLANGRYELLNYLKEESISYDYHRGGSLGIRELELRKPIL